MSFDYAYCIYVQKKNVSTISIYLHSKYFYKYKFIEHETLFFYRYANIYSCVYNVVNEVDQAITLINCDKKNSIVE